MGAGEHTGGGTRVFDVIRERWDSGGCSAWSAPWFTYPDPRFKVYSHQASHEKIGLAYEVVCQLGPTCIVSDISSNTVTLLIQDYRIVGGLMLVSVCSRLGMALWT